MVEETNMQDQQLHIQVLHISGEELATLRLWHNVIGADVRAALVEYVPVFTCVHELICPDGSCLTDAQRISECVSEEGRLILQAVLVACGPLDSLELDTQCCIVQGTRFEISKRYKVLEAVGQGAYGIVCAVQDEQTNETMAIKKTENVFENPLLTKRTLHELRILRNLDHENVIGIRNIMLLGSKVDFEDIYIVSELMETDLAAIVKSPQQLTDDHCQFLLYQMLRAMKYVHSAHVVHRDLKPRNILLNSECDLKICDFALSCVNFNEFQMLSPSSFSVASQGSFVCTRWYRAPEVLASLMPCTSAIDIWSIACIFAEMLRRQPLFPGSNSQHQLQLTISMLGSPYSEELHKIPNKRCLKFIKSLPHFERQVFGDLLTTATPSALDFLQGTLQFDPEKRPPAATALQHAYLHKLHCQEDEPVRTPLDISDFDFNRRRITIEALQEEIFLEALSYYPDKKQRYLREQRHLGQSHNISAYQLLNPGDSDEDCDTGGSAGVLTAL